MTSQQAKRRKIAKRKVKQKAHKLHAARRHYGVPDASPSVAKRLASWKAGEPCRNYDRHAARLERVRQQDQADAGFKSDDSPIRDAVFKGCANAFAFRPK